MTRTPSRGPRRPSAATCPFFTSSTRSRRPLVPVSIVPLTARLRTKPGSGTTGSTLISKTTLVLSPSGRQRVRRVLRALLPGADQRPADLVLAPGVGHHLFVGDARGLHLHLHFERPPVLVLLENFGALMRRRPLGDGVQIADDVEDLLRAGLDHDFAGFVDCHVRTIARRRRADGVFDRRRGTVDLVTDPGRFVLHRRRLPAGPPGRTRRHRSIRGARRLQPGVPRSHRRPPAAALGRQRQRAQCRLRRRRIWPAARNICCGNHIRRRRAVGRQCDRGQLRRARAGRAHRRRPIERRPGHPAGAAPLAG